MRRFASLSCNLSGISVNSAMASLKQKNNGLVYRDKLHEKENHEGKWVTTYFKAPTQTRQENHEQNWVTTYFKALTQTCQGEPRSIKKVGQGRQPEMSMTTWVRAPGVRSPNAASPNYADQGENT